MRKTCLLLAVLWAPAAMAAYKCVDEKGTTHVGDTPPASCATVEMLEVSKSGMILRRIEPSPTPEQLKAIADGAARKKEAEKAAAEQKRKDEALLNTFSGEREFDVVRDRNIEPIKGRIVSAQERIKAVEKRQTELAEEMEFYKAGKSKVAGKERDAPPMLATEMQRLGAEKKVLETNLVAYDKEIEALRTKFDTDKKRWVALKAAAGTEKAPVKK
jgi:chromosome segregation ATPase